MYESVSAEPRGQVWVGGGLVRLPGGESGRGGPLVGEPRSQVD